MKYGIFLEESRFHVQKFKLSGRLTASYGNVDSDTVGETTEIIWEEAGFFLICQVWLCLRIE